MREAARFFALVQTSAADAVIAGFDAKYYFRGWRRFAVGRAAIAEHLAAILPAVPRDVTHDVKSEHVHFVTADLAICDSAGETHRDSASAGEDVRSVEAFTLIAIRDHGEWLWAGLRSILLPK